MTLRLAVLASVLLLSLASLAHAQELPPPPLPTPTLPTEPPAMPAAPARALTLVQAMQLASQDASDPRLAAFAVRRSEAAERTALASLLPSILGQVNYNRYDRELQFSGTVVRPENAYDVDLIASESLSLRAWNATRITGEQTRNARLTTDDAKRRTRSAAARAFFAVLTARRNAELARSQLAQAIRNDQVVATRVELGTAVPLDRARSELAVLDALQRVTTADQQLGSQWDLLGQALGQEGPVDASDGGAPEAGETLSQYVDRALSGRPDVQARHTAIRVAELNVDDAWMRFVPTLQLSWTGTYRGPATLISPDGGTWTFVASLVVPFYDGGARYAAIDDAHAQVADAQEREAALRRNVRVEVRDAFRRAETSKRAIELAEQSLTVAQANATRAETVYREGAANGLELEDARRSLEQSQITLLLRRLDRELAVIDLLAASAQL